MTLTRRGQVVMQTLGIVAALSIGGTALLLASTVGEQRRCQSLGSAPAAALYGCPQTASGAGAGQGEGHKPAPVATSSTPTRVAPRQVSKASRSRVTPTRAAAGSLLDVTCYLATGNRTASGVWPAPGMAAGNRWALGTRLHVQGLGTYTVTDRIGHGSDVDLFFTDRAACLSFGRQHLLVTVR
jgi:3D (Asp-Asp-Asp) domain-containing protein